MRKIKAVFIVLIVLFASFMLVCSKSAKEGATTGLLICFNVIIPTLFPFTFCVLFLTNALNTKKQGFLSKITMFLFGLQIDEFIIFSLSLIGGYPTGAKLIDKHFSDLNKDHIKPNLMLCYCVNAGPAFIVMALGTEILNSKLLGWLLLSAHLVASLIIALILRRFIAKHESFVKTAKGSISIFENFVTSASDSASAVLSVCIYVILFSVINVFLGQISKYIPFFKNISSLLEITTAVSNSKNLYHIAFLLGFGGVCVWCQIFATIKNFKINLPYFITARVLHGVLSDIIMFLLLKIFKISIATFSNCVSAKSDLTYRSVPLSISLIVLGVFFIISTLPNHWNDYNNIEVAK